MPALIALAASVGLLAVLDTWLFFGPLSGTLVAGLVWVSFIAWGCHFHSGGGTKGTTTTVVCMSWGALVGMLVSTMGSSFWPITTEGRILAFLLSVYGLAVFGYLTATFASFFIGRDAEDAGAPVAGAAELTALRREIQALRLAVEKNGQARAS